jgi:hypothetical protein
LCEATLAFALRAAQGLVIFRLPSNVLALTAPASALYPKLKILIISGFADLEGVSPDIPRLNKPFRHHELVTGLSELSTL